MKWLVMGTVSVSLSVCLTILSLVGRDDTPPKPLASDGAKLARVCHDGSHIWLYTDGKYHTSWNQEVVDVDKVCQ